MNHATLSPNLRRRRPRHFLPGSLAALVWLGALTGCDTTRQVRETPKDFSGFLGDYSLLMQGGGKEANYLYIDLAADWPHYTQVCIQPVELWKSADPDSPLGRFSPADQRLLVSFLNTALANALGRDFRLVNQPGPGVLVVHCALTDARKSKPVLNLISSVYPPALAISYGKQALVGTGTGVGVVRVEADFTDGRTGRRVAAAVDARAGTKALRSKFDGSWGDVELAFDWWAERCRARLAAFKQNDFTADQL